MKKVKPFIPEDLQVVDLNVFHLLNLQNLLSPPKNKPPENKIIVIFGKNKIYKLYHSKKGSLNSAKYNNLLFDKKTLLEELAEDFKAKQVIAFSKNFFEKFFAKFQQQLNYDEDYFKQVLLGVNLFARELNKSIYFYPEFKIPTILSNYNFISILIYLLVPANYDFLLLFLQQEKIKSSLLVKVRNQQIKTLATLEYFTDKEKILGKNLPQKIKNLITDIPQLYPRNFIIAFEEFGFKHFINSPNKRIDFLNLIKSKNIFVKPFYLLLVVLCFFAFNKGK